MAKQKSRFPSYGLVRGPSHERGGVAGMVAGEQPVELEGGEWIIPKEAVPDYLPVLKQITNEGRAMQQMQNGNSAMDALIASATMETGLAQPKSPMYQEGGQMPKLDIRRGPQSRSEQEALMDRMWDNVYKMQAELVDEKLLDEVWENARKKDKESSGVFDAPRYVHEPGTTGVSMMGDYVDSYSYLTDPPDAASNQQVGLGEMLRHYTTGYGNPLSRAFKNLVSQKQGGMINQYQQGGQMQPRKQQEIRNPHMYGSASGSPAFLPSSSPDTTSESLQQILDQTLINPETYGPPDSLMGPDTTSGGLNELLEYYKESERRNQLNALTGDTLDPQLDSLRLLQRMQKSKMPTYGRKNMQQGGPVMYQQGGQVLGKGQPLSSEYQKRADEFVQYDPNPAGYTPLANQTMPGALLGSIGSDKRIKPLRPDTYIKKMPLAKTFDPSNMNYGLYQEEVEEVPKLSTAYLASFGMETPLSRNQSRLLFRKGIAPDTLNPKVKGLINRALVQRLANEED